MSDNLPKTTNLNPFANGSGQQALQPQSSGGNAMMTAEMQRSIAEIQASFMVAMHRPRNPIVCADKMLLECQRPSLANISIYSFARGGTQITGLSIRALEMIARNWGNIKYGFRCLERRKGASLMQAYAYDLEQNVPIERIFEVKHVRDTKGGQKSLTDERDIYEMEANQAQRRVRACIEALIPADVLDMCEQEFKKTMAADADTSNEGIKKMLDIFQSFGVSQKMIEARIQRNITSIEAAQIVSLRAVYNSLKDGMSSIDQWFDLSLSEKAETIDEKKIPAKKKGLEEFKKENTEVEVVEEKPPCEKCQGKGFVESTHDDGEVWSDPCECQKK